MPLRVTPISLSTIWALYLNRPGFTGEIVEAFRAFDLFETGAELLKGLWDGIASLVPQMVAAISEKLSDIVPDWMQDAWNWATGADHPPGDTISINIYPGAGMSVEDIGRKIERRLARREDARRADLHHGVDY